MKLIEVAEIKKSNMYLVKRGTGSWEVRALLDNIPGREGALRFKPTGERYPGDYDITIRAVKDTINYHNAYFYGRGSFPNKEAVLQGKIEAEEGDRSKLWVSTKPIIELPWRSEG